MVDDVLDGGRPVDAILELIPDVEKGDRGQCLCAVEIVDVLEVAVLRVVGFEVLDGQAVALPVDEDVSAFGAA